MSVRCARRSGPNRCTVACVDQIIPYDVGDEHGATLSLEQIVSQRVTPNILVAENAGVANRLRELGSNVLAARAGDVTHVTIAHPVVAVAQAAVALVPVEFGRAWALREVQRSLEAELGKASPARVRALEVPAKALLGVETLKTEVARLCGEPLTDVLTVARASQNSRRPRPTRLSPRPTIATTRRCGLASPPRPRRWYSTTVM